MTTVMTWNVRDLFLQGARETRLKHVAGIIKDVDADVVCVQEIRGTAPDTSLWQLAEAAGLDCRAVPGWIDYEGGDGEADIVAVGIGDADFHVGIMWRPGIKPVPGSWRQIGRGEGGLWHAAATIGLDVGGPVPLTIVNCHLDPFRPEYRFGEAARIASLAVGRTALVCGDFNCVSSDRRPDGSAYDPDPLAETGWHDAATFQAAWDEDADAPLYVDRRAAERLRRAGLVDAACALDAPWQPTSGHWDDDPHGPRRVDRILATPAALPALRTYWVADTEVTRSQSDHLPAVVTLDPAALT